MLDRTSAYGIILAALLLCRALPLGCPVESRAEGVMTNDLHDFEQFMQRRAEAASAYVRGDAAPLDSIVAREGAATFFAPRGGVVQDVDAVSRRYLQDAQSFAPRDRAD